MKQSAAMTSKRYICWYAPIMIVLIFGGCATSSLNNWTFKEQRSVTVVTEKVIIEGVSPILYVFRDSVDGQWIFLSDEKSTGDEVAFVTLEAIVKIDESVKQLSDLPAGWKAWREAKDKPWSRSRLKREHN
jgi:hypothetical protein